MVRRAGLLLLLAGSLGQSSAQGLAIELLAPREVRVREHAVVELRVSLPNGAQGPLLVTPVAEGEALEAVRGRFMRGDALAPDERPLRFRLPVVARAAGTSILRAHVLAYVCVDGRCEAVESEARAHIVVLTPQGE